MTGRFRYAQQHRRILRGLAQKNSGGGNVFRHETGESGLFRVLPIPAGGHIVLGVLGHFNRRTASI